MAHPIGTTGHLHQAIERMHEARANVHHEAAARVSDHPISDIEDWEDSEDD